MDRQTAAPGAGTRSKLGFFNPEVLNCPGLPRGDHSLFQPTTQPPTPRQPHARRPQENELPPQGLSAPVHPAAGDRASSAGAGAFGGPRASAVLTEKKPQSLLQVLETIEVQLT